MFFATRRLQVWIESIMSISPAAARLKYQQVQK